MHRPSTVTLASHARRGFCSIDYHRVAVEPNASKIYKGDNREEEALILSLEQQKSAAVEPALFLAGINGWKSQLQSDDDKNRWEIYFNHDTAKANDNKMVLFHSGVAM